MSLSRWLEALIYEQMASVPARRHHLYSEGPCARPDDLVAPGSLPFATAGSGDIPDAHHAAGSALRTIVVAFPPRISHAAMLLSAAFAEADVKLALPRHRSGARKATQYWYNTLVDTCLHRSREVRTALLHQWTPSGPAERLWGDAFFTLCELTPARQELSILYSRDRNRASAEFVKHLDLATQQFVLSANLLVDVESASPAEPTEEQRFAQTRAMLLDRAGGGVSLTEGSRLLGVTRQALHKRIKAGSALGMMDRDEIVLPRLQWTEVDDKVEVLPGLPAVVRLFSRAGGWSALQFLLDPDPNLGRPPVEGLRRGEVDATVAAARAFLGLDEG